MLRVTAIRIYHQSSRFENIDKSSSGLISKYRTSFYRSSVASERPRTFYSRYFSNLRWWRWSKKKNNTLLITTTRYHPSVQVEQINKLLHKVSFKKWTTLEAPEHRRRWRSRNNVRWSCVFAYKKNISEKDSLFERIYKKKLLRRLITLFNYVYHHIGWKLNRLLKLLYISNFCLFIVLRNGIIFFRDVFFPRWKDSADVIVLISGKYNFWFQEYSPEAVSHVHKYLMKNEVPVNLFEVGPFLIFLIATHDNYNIYIYKW